MSGYTPTGISWSTERTKSTVTSFLRMISIEILANPSVWESSGERFKVQLMNNALRSEKSQPLSRQRASCFSVRAMTSFRNPTVDIPPCPGACFLSYVAVPRTVPTTRTRGRGRSPEHTGVAQAVAARLREHAEPVRAPADGDAVEHLPGARVDDVHRRVVPARE